MRLNLPIDFFPMAGIVVSEDRTTSVEEIIKAAHEHRRFFNQEALVREATRVFKLASAIKANGGYMPRPDELEKLGLVVEPV